MASLRCFFHLASFLILTLSCSKDGTQEDIMPQRLISILVIGNSYSRDAFSYVPAIIESSCNTTSVEMDILQIGGVSLDTHLDALIQQLPSFVLDEYNNGWISTGGCRAGPIICKKNWDLVIIQEGGIVARSYDKTKANVSGIVSYIKKEFPEIDICFMLNPTHPEGSSMLGSFGSNEEFSIICNVAAKLVDERIVNEIVPCGTAIQLARSTYLDDLGDYGHLSYEGRHLQEGLPCLIEAYAASQFIMNRLHLDATIYDSELQIDQPWVDGCNVPGQHGRVITGTDVDYALCKQCAYNAVAYPYSSVFKLIHLRDRFPNLFPGLGFTLEAHRGFSSEYPENTEIAFQAAADIPFFKGIETDIQMSKDGVLVCMHDIDLSRTTNGKGKVSDYSYKQLRELYITGGNGWNEIYHKKLRIPTFERFLEICAETGKTPYVELKLLSENGIKAVVSMLHDKGFPDGTYVLTSFNKDYLEYASTISSAPLEYMKNSVFSARDIIDISENPQYVVRLSSAQVTEEFVHFCHAFGLLVEVYGIGVGNKSLMDHLVLWGVEGGTCDSWKGF